MTVTANGCCDGTFECSCCGDEFSLSNPCCCDEGNYADGSHTDGICRRCCAPRHAGPQLDYVNHRGE